MSNSEEKKLKNIKSLMDLWYNNKRPNMCVIGGPNGEEKST